MKKSITTALGILLGMMLSFASIAHATTVLFPYGGGTGTSTAPTYGQVLVGNSGGTYTPTATSSLGIISGSSYTSTFPIQISGTTIGFGGLSTSSPLSSGLLVQSTGVNTIANISTSSLGLLTTNVAEGTNLYFTTARATANFISNLAATTSVSSITTLSNLSLPYSQLTGVPTFDTFAYPFPNNATSTALTFSGGLSVANNLTLSGITGSTQCLHVNSSGVVSGTGSDCGTGSGGVSSVSGTYPIVSSGGTTPAISLAFGTTTANVWSGLNTFNGGLTIGSLTGTLNANSGVVYSTATSSLSVGSPLTVTGTLGSLIGGTNSTINCQTASGSQAGCLSSTDWTTFNGKDSFAYPFPAGATSTALTIDNATFLAGSGNVGIGTTTPSSELYVGNAGSIGEDIGTNDGIFQTAITNHIVGNVGSIGIGINDGGGKTGVFVNNAHGYAGTPSIYNSQYITFNTDAGGIAVSTERMRIDPFGNVGIGTTSPNSLLTVSGNAPTLNIADTSGSGVATLQLSDAGGDNYTIGRNNNTGFLNFNGTQSNYSGYNFQTSNGATNALTILNSGYVGIGTTSPIDALHVYTAGNGGITIQSANSGQLAFRPANGSNTGGFVIGRSFAGGDAQDLFIYDRTANANRLEITSAGNVGIGTTTPANTLDVYGGITTNGGTNASQSAGPSLTISDQSSSGYIQSLWNAVAWEPLVAQANTFSFLSNGSTQGLYQNATGQVGVGTTSPGSLLSIGNTNGINFSTATSTFNSTGGINLTSGCFAVGGTCIGGGGGYSPIGTTGKIPYFSATNTLTATSSIFIATSGNVGIGNTSPATNLFIQAASGQNPFEIQGTINSTNYDTFEIDQYGHIITSGPTPTVTQNSGTNSGVVGNDNSGVIGPPSTGSPNTFTLTFAKTWNNTPVCTAISNLGTLTVSSVSTTQLVLVDSISNGSTQIWYICQGHQ